MTKDVLNTCVITVIGEDRKLHLAVPSSNVCLCGVKIIDKKPDTKYIERLFSCYDCIF